MLKNKKHYVKVLLKSFHLSGHSTGFFSQTQKLDEPRCTRTLYREIKIHVYAKQQT